MNIKEIFVERNDKANLTVYGQKTRKEAAHRLVFWCYGFKFHCGNRTIDACINDKENIEGHEIKKNKVDVRMEDGYYRIFVHVGKLTFHSAKLPLEQTLEVWEELTKE